MRGKAASVGDTNVSANGYHYTRTTTRWRLTHHLLAEANLNRNLHDDEQAYFIDGDKTHLVMENVGVRAKQTSHSKRKGQLFARIEQLCAEYVELDPDHVKDLQVLVETLQS